MYKAAVGFICLIVLVFPGISLASEVSESCVKDLNFLPAFLLENDSGGKDILEQKGQVFLDRALTTALDKAQSVSTLDDCKTVVREYLSAWRHSHISIRTLESDADSSEAKAGANTESQQQDQPKIDPLLPQLEFLSDKTALLTIYHFHNRYRQPLEALLNQHREALQKHPNWIIDVRRNGGGTDSTYKQLLSWVMINETANTHTNYLMTPTNLEWAEKICPLAAPGDKECEEHMGKVAAKMKQVEPGAFVSPDELITFDSKSASDFKHPQRVAVVTGKDCGSSCEQFVLDIRQSFNVKVIGSNTYGALDYSNLRPQILPSGKLELRYTVSRSARLPNSPVDITGIAPDIFLPPAENEEDYSNEIVRIKNWIEGGSLAPNNE